MDWINIKDKLPEKDTPVLCYYYDKYMDVMEYWDTDEKGNPEFFKAPYPFINQVTHWMPLPKPPEI